MTNNRLIDLTDVIYLTSQACEDTGNVDELKLDSLGLESGSFMDSSYPLTDTEACFIGEDVAEMAGHLALTGYSVLIGNRKYLAPTIELNYQVWNSKEDPEEQSEKWAMDANEKLRPICQKIAEMTGGYYVWNPEAAVEFENGDGRFTIEIYIPFEYAQEHANGFEQWKDHLTSLATKAKEA